MPEDLKVGYYVLILGAGEKLEDEIEKGERFHRIVTEEALEANSTDLSLTDAFASVTTGDESGFKDHEKLEPREDPAELYQVRLGVEDGCDYYAKLPSGTERFGVYEKKDIGVINSHNSPRHAKNGSFEFWLIHGLFPSFNAKNNTGYSITPNVYFSGRKYNILKVGEGDVLERLKSASLPYRVICLGGGY